MGLEYVFVHLKYTIPPAVALTLLYRPLLTKMDIYKLGFLISVAVISTLPWDSYLIRKNIWSYPSHVIVGQTFFKIPVEEIFFFIVQTYNTSLFYLILSKPTYQPVLLTAVRGDGHPNGVLNPEWRNYRVAGQLVLVGIIGWGWCMVLSAGRATYAGLIIIWAVPFLVFLWTLAYQFIISLPLSNTLAPIMLPTVYLWMVDTLALQRGTWVINPGTKMGVHLWDGLEIEEALFFLLTNVVIVFGQIAFDSALSILSAFPDLFPDSPPLPSPAFLMRASLMPASRFDENQIAGLREAVQRLEKKSRSFYVASSAFQSQIRTDLILLYSFCRVADDLVDDARNPTEARTWIARLQEFLERAYDGNSEQAATSNFIRTTFPKETQAALIQVPIKKLSRQPLEDLLRGFEMDMCFCQDKDGPILVESDLDIYAHRVAGTVANMCLELILYDYDTHVKGEDRQRIIEAGDRMGVALQCVNIARDIAVDASMGRVYIPRSWLKKEGLSASSILHNPHRPVVEKLRSQLLKKAFALHKGAKDAIEELPVEARGPRRVAVESYMEIGRVLRREGYVVKAGRATVPKLRRLRVAWKSLRSQ
ncbi:Lycopene beta-cyclase [Westerdykella ornata]|uniref:Bifunctional lycopene cyclase/phytoene synthase n=1 Tax=Westerdykella ornata TaxID=318751 RepID=A0A6A6JGW1_WESOR|nr:Lycopene beta-cyclase [Westerdykella ornata]KAF2274459.1 Lycopene beta-cyclase [Westerdykella ornata]